VQHVVVIAPVDADEDEAHQVGGDHRGEGTQRLQRGSVRHLQFEDHDGDDDGDDAVAECFQARFSHIRQSRFRSIVSSLQLPYDNSQKYPLICTERGC
jgi:hypothetical protein